MDLTFFRKAAVCSPTFRSQPTMVGATVGATNSGETGIDIAFLRIKVSQGSKSKPLKVIAYRPD